MNRNGTINTLFLLPQKTNSKHIKKGRDFQIFQSYLGEKTLRFNNLQVLDKFIGEKHHLYKRNYKKKCGNYKEKRGEWPATCKKGAKILQIIEK
jgi:hypothetical protein